MNRIIYAFLILTAIACDSSNKSGGSSKEDNSEAGSFSNRSQIERTYLQQSQQLIIENRRQINRVLGPNAANTMLDQLRSTPIEVTPDQYAGHQINERGVSVYQGVISIDPIIYSNYLRNQRNSRRQQMRQKMDLMHELIELMGQDDSGYYYSESILRNQRRY